MSALFNPATGEINPHDEDCPNCARALTERLQAEEDLRGAERELRRVRREVTGLRSELNKRRSDSPEAYKAKALFRYWVARCDKNAKRTVFGEKRIKAVMARLGDHDTEYIARAIDGLAVGAFINEQGVKYDELELCCRDEVHLERFYEMAERFQAPTLMGPVWLKEFEGSLEPAQEEAPF